MGRWSASLQRRGAAPVAEFLGYEPPHRSRKSDPSVHHSHVKTRRTRNRPDERLPIARHRTEPDTCLSDDEAADSTEGVADVESYLLRDHVDVSRLPEAVGRSEHPPAVILSNLDTRRTHDPSNEGAARSQLDQNRGRAR